MLDKEGRKPFVETVERLASQIAASTGWNERKVKRFMGHALIWGGNILIILSFVMALWLLGLI